MVDPATATFIATALATAAKGGGEYLTNKKSEKGAKKRAKETRRETQSNLLNAAMQKSAELEAGRLESRKKLGKKKAQSYQDTADLVRGALNI